MTEKFTEEKLKQKFSNLLREINTIESIIPSNIAQYGVYNSFDRYSIYHSYDQFRKIILEYDRSTFETNMIVAEMRLKQWKNHVEELFTDILDHKVLDE